MHGTIAVFFRLHREIKEFYEEMLPSTEEQIMREGVVERITSIVKSLWSGAKVQNLLPLSTDFCPIAL